MGAAAAPSVNALMGKEMHEACLLAALPSSYLLLRAVVSAIRTWTPCLPVLKFPGLSPEALYSHKLLLDPATCSLMKTTAPVELGSFLVSQEVGRRPWGNQGQGWGEESTDPPEAESLRQSQPLR